MNEKKMYSRQNPLVIAELGTSHQGELSKLKEMAEAASESGAGCVKLQMVFADEILHPNTGEVDLPGGKIKLYDSFKRLEKPLEFYAQAKTYIEDLGLLFLCTPFGLKSAALLKQLNPKILKIASPELNYTKLLEEISGWNFPVLLSTGVSKLKDIEAAMEIFSTASVKPTLLHCVTSYPAPESDYNLRVIKSLACVFGTDVGVSDHSLDPELIPALSVSQGASVIEKHFCLSRDDPGLDDPIALTPKNFKVMADAVRIASSESEDETIARFTAKHGREKIEEILGSGVKKLADCERENYTRTNRSIHAVRTIQCGEILSESDFAVLRTEKILRPGLEPSFENFIAGRTARQNIPAGEGIRFEDLG